MRRTGLIFSGAVLLGGCQSPPASSPAPAPAAAPVVRDVASAPKPTELMLVDEQYESGADKWTAKWSYRADEPLNFKGNFAGSIISLGTEQMVAQSGRKPVEGTIRTEMKRSGKRVECLMELTQKYRDGSPPSFSTYINLAPLKIGGSLQDSVREKWRGNTEQVPSEWTLLEYKENGKWIPVRMKVFKPSGEKAPPGKMSSSRLK